MLLITRILNATIAKPRANVLSVFLRTRNVTSVTPKPIAPVRRTSLKIYNALQMHSMPGLIICKLFRKWLSDL